MSEKSPRQELLCLLGHRKETLCGRSGVSNQGGSRGGMRGIFEIKVNGLVVKSEREASRATPIIVL